MAAVHDFNYKVALASGLKHLQGGKLKQAEEQFRYLVSKFPKADGGYRGLARVQVELGDKAAALATLRDGAAVLSRVGDRPTAIDLLHEAMALDPRDLAGHRRLAAALALAGDVSAAAQEYVRFATAEIETGDPDRARLEATYALETLGELPALRELARTLDLPLRTVRRELPAEPAPSEPAPEPEAPAEAEPEPSARAAEASALLSAAVELQRSAPVDPIALEERALSLIASRDKFAGPVAIQAAGALLADGKVDAASDLLLQLVASGIAVHEAERALIDVARAMGRGDVAEERERLLGEAQRLG